MKIKIIDDDIQFIDSLKNNLTGEFDHVLINGSTSFDDEYDYDIYFLDTKVLMARKGEISTKQVYDLKNITKSIYKTPYLITEFEIKTLKIEKINKWYLLEYELYSNGSLMNKIIARFNEK